MLRFQHPQFFVLLALLPVLFVFFYLARRKKKSIAKKIADPGLLGYLIKDYRPLIYNLKFIFLTIALGLLVIAAVNPRKPTGFVKVERNGINVMIVLDVSKSMLARDIRPSRLERAKQFCLKLVDKLNNDRVGIVVFAGKAYLQMPLTPDVTAAKMYINAADPDQIPAQGTVISSALQMAASSFSQEEKKYKAIVLISDGEDHDENAIKTARELAAQGAVIYTLGIGSPQGAVIPDQNTGQPKLDKNGDMVLSKLNETELRSISEATKGKYILFENTDPAVDEIVSDMSKMDQRPVTDDSLTHFESFAFYFLGIAFLLLIIEFFMREKRKINNNLVKKIAVMLPFLFVCSHSLFAQKANKLVKEGNTLYQDKKYNEASKLYDEAITLNPNLPEAFFNKGNAGYRAGKTDEALADYDDAIKLLNDPVNKSNTFYNKGVVLQNSKKLPECIEAYKKALILDPSNEDARQNLQKALQQQQQQNKEQNREKNEQKKKDRNQPKPQPAKIKKQDAIDKLKALEQQEKALRDKLNKVNTSPLNSPEKDW